MLTDIAVKNAKKKDKPYKMADGHSLYLYISSSGGKLWRFDYTFMGKRKTLSFGAYPEIPLAKARELRDEARRLLAEGKDPMIYKKTKKLNTFESVARSWFDTKKKGWSVSHSDTIIQRLENHVFPIIGNRPISDITHDEMLSVIRRLEAKGVNETAHRVNQICGQVFKYGIILHLCKSNPAADLRGALAPVQHKHFATITEPKERSQRNAV